MKRFGLSIAAISLVFLVAGCAPGSPSAPTPSGSPSISASPSESASASPAAPTAVKAADYITDGAVGAANTTWQATYSFYADAAKVVLCDIATNSETPNSAGCEIVKGKESLVKYTVPPPVTGQCDPTNGANYRGDGYQVGLGIFQAIGVDTGFYGCRELESQTPAVISASKVIPDNSTITAGDIICTVKSEIATCGYTTPGNKTSFTFGLTVATFSF